MCRCDSATVQKWKKRARNFAMACFFLVGGIEYSVIFPTMWDYMQSFGGKAWLYGLCLSAFSISNFFTGPLYGLVFDRTHKTLFIVLFANLFEIGGNFMYFAAKSKYMILGSRFIVGMGAGAGAAIFGELARTSTNKERTAVFSVFMSMRQIGLIIGPAFNLLLRKFNNVKVGPFILSKFTAPGALMMIVFIVIEVLFIVFFFELPAVLDEDEAEEKDSTQESNKSSSQAQIDADGHSAVTGGHLSCQHPERASDHSDASSDCSITATTIQIDSSRTGPQDPPKTDTPQDPLDSSCKLKDEDYFDGKVNENERTPLLAECGPLSGQSVNSHHQEGDPHSAGSYGSIYTGSKESVVATAGETCCEKVGRLRKHVWWLISEFTREQIIVLLSVLFVTMFDQTAIEAMLVPMAEDLLWWNERDTSYFYSAAGGVIIVGFVFVLIASKKFGDRWLMVTGLLLEVFAYAWLVGTISNATHETPWVLWRFIIGAGPAIFGLPLFFVTGASLYSKFLPMHIQGFGQGVRRSVLSIAAILGPLWAGGGFAFDNYYVLLTVPFGLLLLLLAMVLASFTRLKEPGKKKSSVGS